MRQLTGCKRSPQGRGSPRPSEAGQLRRMAAGGVAGDTRRHGCLRCGAGLVLPWAGPGPRGAALPPPFPGGPRGPSRLSPESPLEPGALGAASTGAHPERGPHQSGRHGRAGQSRCAGPARRRGAGVGAGPDPPGGSVGRGCGTGSRPGRGSASHQLAQLVVPVPLHSLLCIEASAQRDGPQRGRLEIDPERPGASRLAVKALPSHCPLDLL